MMLAAVKIKEEPLDEIEESQENFKQEEDLMKHKIDGWLPNSANNFHIVEEQESIITISAAEMKSEDELRFIDSLSNADTNKFKGVCSKCLKLFTNRVHFLKHTRRNNCVTKQWCPVCPVTFIDTPSMLNHLNLHRENYFFCSHHCGANFATLPLCEEHELKEHKIQATIKIRFKHSCSFCRTGFKTELQLHVHWLQQTQGCGKLMQDVVLHSTNLTNAYSDKDLKKSKNLLSDKELNSPTTNTVSSIPITKLRLKYDTSSTKKTINKRQNFDYVEDKDTKRFKDVLDNIKTETEANQLPFNYDADIEIKEEPADDYENTIIPNLIPEVIIKTEEVTNNETQENDQKPLMKNLVINNNMIGPESNGKFIPLEHLVSVENGKPDFSKEMKTFSLNNLGSSNLQTIDNKSISMVTQNSPVLKIVNHNINNANNNINNVNNNINNVNLNTVPNATIKTEGSLRLFKIIPAPAPLPIPNTTFANVNFANIQNFSSGKLMSIKLANSPNHNGDVKPLPKSGLQIIKFLPNIQFNNNNLLGNNKPPLVLKLKYPQTSPVQVINQMPTPTVPILLSTTPTTQSCSAATIPPTNSSSKTVSIKLNSLEQNTTIDAEDFKKLQTEALIKADEHRKNLYIPKTRLMIIENIPEKKQLIDNMKQIIAEVKDKTTEQIQGKPGGNFMLNTKTGVEPRSLYLPILTTMDLELVQARYQYTNYHYKWICPYCVKDYEIKTALKMHLIKAHNLNGRDMEKINVQAKPYRKEALAEPIGEMKQDIKEDAIIPDTDSQAQTTSKTDSVAVEITTNVSPTQDSNLKQQRQRYVCDKCGRTCSSKIMLSDHILANCSREPQYSCQKCPKKFYSHGTLQCHMTIHTGELPHKCSYCDKRFRTRGQVKVHHRIHTGERPFFCQVCSQRFTHRETLIAHLSRHIGMKRYKCYGCDKHFSCISALKTHRDIRADTCGKVKFNPRAIGPRVRVIRGNVIFEPQPEINPYLKSEDPKCVLSELQNQSGDTKNVLTELQNQSVDSKTVIFEMQKPSNTLHFN